ncbi:MAG: hypothetical protein ABJD07_15980 [Gemmatimonadaceae bacterium]
MHPDLVALLALQADDVALGALEKRRKTLDAQTALLDQERAAATGAVERVRAQIETEEVRQRDLQMKVDEHKQHQEHNISQLDAVRKQREATAATSQIDIMRKVLATEESEMHAIVGRITDMRHALKDRDAELAVMDAHQETRRAELLAEREALAAETADANAKRADAASHVSKGTLGKYERIRTRQPNGALWAIRNGACGRCNTAIPLQRRNVIAGGKSIEVCEGCGVLLYAAP